MGSKKTITLTGRTPVTVNTDKWELVASASDKDYEGQYESQSFRTSKWFLGVRSNGTRSIIYATYGYCTAWQGERSMFAKRGVIIDTTDDEAICRAITEVCSDIAGLEHSGNDADRWVAIRDACMADMPAEELE